MDDTEILPNGSEGRDIPGASSLEAVRANSDCQGWSFGVINWTLPRWLPRLSG